MTLPVIDRALRAGERRRYSRYTRQLDRITALAPGLDTLTETELRAQASRMRDRARSSEPLDSLLAEAFALTREASRRRLGMRHYDVQLIGAMAMHERAIAEMRTGEGKTLTATPAAVLHALSGHGVHVVTVNDYLADRDARWMGPIYETLGLSVGIITTDLDSAARRAAYACDITYVTHAQLGFDYLRDNLVTDASKKVLRGQHFAIVDEVDNILIDEARTPLIIAGEPETDTGLHDAFTRLARQMTPGVRPTFLRRDRHDAKAYRADYDYDVDAKHQAVGVTELGIARAEKFLGVEHLYQPEHGHLVNMLNQALKAQALFHRDIDYAVIDGEVHIIDEHTGRILAGRRWQDGLHQAVEAKEGLRVHPENPTVASVTYQNLFRLYTHLAGMTGTAMTDAAELYRVYKLAVVEIPTHRPVKRLDHPDRVYASKAGKWDGAVAETLTRHRNGQPVLIGTASVEDSELLSTRLRAEGVSHNVLNAKPEHAAREAEIVAQAGRLRAVTIATNMAGRGVDILLGGDPDKLAAAHPAELDDALHDLSDREHTMDAWRDLCAIEREQVLSAGGLFVLGTERFESRRIDLQLRGRAGRQGDPGETLFVISAQDELIRRFSGDRLFNLLDRLSADDADGRELPLESALLAKQVEKAQRRVEEQRQLERQRVLEYDDVLAEQRRVIYRYRDMALNGGDLAEFARRQTLSLIEQIAERHVRDELLGDSDLDTLTTRVQQLIPGLTASGEGQQLIQALVETAAERYDTQGPGIGLDAATMRDVTRQLTLHAVDEHWREHLDDMDYLRHGISLRAHAQINPIDAYRAEAFELFSSMIDAIWQEYASMYFRLAVSEPDAA